MERRLRENAFDPENFMTDDISEEDFRVIKAKRFSTKPMDVEEAILQMNLLGHAFFVFVNAATQETNVVYKRNDGDYGLIEPEG